MVFLAVLTGVLVKLHKVIIDNIKLYMSFIQFVWLLLTARVVKMCAVYVLRVRSCV